MQKADEPPQQKVVLYIYPHGKFPVNLRGKNFLKKSIYILSVSSCGKNFSSDQSKKKHSCASKVKQNVFDYINCWYLCVEQGVR